MLILHCFIPPSLLSLQVFVPATGSDSDGLLPQGQDAAEAAAAGSAQFPAPRRVVKPYIMDLESTNGTFLNGKKIEPAR